MRLLGGVLPLKCAKDVTLVECSWGWIVCYELNMLGIKARGKSEA